MLQASTKDVEEFAQKLTEELNTAATSGKIQMRTAYPMAIHALTR